MAKQLEKLYNPKEVEDRTYQFWMNGGYFTDVYKRQPLEQAVKTIRQYGLENRVFPVLSDGVKAVSYTHLSS